jgi:hypothetical protein
VAPVSGSCCSDSDSGQQSRVTSLSIADTGTFIPHLQSAPPPLLMSLQSIAETGTFIPHHLLC